MGTKINEAVAKRMWIRMTERLTKAIVNKDWHLAAQLDSYISGMEQMLVLADINYLGWEE